MKKQSSPKKSLENDFSRPYNEQCLIRYSGGTYKWSIK